MLKRRAPGLAWLPVALRDKLTPTMLGSAVAALSVSIAYVVNAQHEIHNTQSEVRRLRQSVEDMQKEQELLHKIDTQLAVINGKIEGIMSEVDRQREWRERIEDAAESPPHARRRR